MRVFAKIRRYLRQGTTTGILTMTYLVLNKLNVGYVLENKIVLFRCSHGYLFHAPLSDHWRFTGQSHFEPLTTAFIEDNVNSGDLVVDVGAHIGIHTVHAAKLGARVIAVEPVKGNAELLWKNIKINNVENNVILVESAACDPLRRELTIYLHRRSGAHSAVRAENPRAAIKVPCVTVDSLVEGMDIKAKVKILKIDVEGFEVQVLSGAINLIKDKKIDYIIVEVDNNTLNKINSIMLKHDYSLLKRLDSYGERFNVVYAPRR